MNAPETSALVPARDAASFEMAACVSENGGSPVSPVRDIPAGRCAHCLDGNGFDLFV